MREAISEFIKKLNQSIANLQGAGYMSPQSPIFNAGGFACRNCFPGHIKVLTPEGPERISRLSEGDSVVGYLDGQLEVTQIQRVIQRTVARSELIRLRFGQYRKNSIVSTQDHPFYETKRGWIAAKDLRVGDELFFLPKGQVLSFYKRVSNPMKRPELVKKVQGTLARLRSEGRIPRHYPWSQEARQRVSERMRLHNPMKDPVIAMRAAMSHDYEEVGRKGWSNRKVNFPSGPEQSVIKIIEENQLPIWYVGDGKMWVKRDKQSINPDFKVHNQRKVIEVWQAGFRGRDQAWAEGRRREWEVRNFECLMLKMPSYLSRVNQKETLQALQLFVSNGLPIIGIDRPSYHQLTVDVWNIESGTHNFFAKNSTYMPWVLVHNCDQYRKIGLERVAEGIPMREIGDCLHPKVQSKVEYNGCCNYFIFHGVATQT